MSEKRGRATSKDGRHIRHRYCKLNYKTGCLFQMVTVTVTIPGSGTAPATLATDLWTSGAHDHRVQKGKTTGLSDLEKMAALKRYVHVCTRAARGQSGEWKYNSYDVGRIGTGSRLCVKV